MRFKVKALINFNDLEENKHRVIGEVFECFKTRCDYLLEHKAIEIVEEVKEESKIELKEENIETAIGNVPNITFKEKQKPTKKKKSSKR